MTSNLESENSDVECKKRKRRKHNSQKYYRSDSDDEINASCNSKENLPLPPSLAQSDVYNSDLMELSVMVETENSVLLSTLDQNVSHSTQSSSPISSLPPQDNTQDRFMLLTESPKLTATCNHTDVTRKYSQSIILIFYSFISTVHRQIP